MLFPGFRAKLKKNTMNRPLYNPTSSRWKIQLGNWLEGCCLASPSAVCGHGQSSNLLAGSLANCWLESLLACQLAAVADKQA